MPNKLATSIAPSTQQPPKPARPALRNLLKMVTNYAEGEARKIPTVPESAQECPEFRAPRECRKSLERRRCRW